VKKRDIVVVGGSAGGIRALLALTAALPARFAASVFVVLHTSRDSPGLLPEILSQRGWPLAQHATNETPFEPGNIYIAPPDRHLLVTSAGRMRLTHGPKENRFRPAIDPLFRSAAVNFGPRVIGIIISGGLDDGVAGLSAIKTTGGLAIVQHIDDAEVPTLPRNALAHVEVDHCLPAGEIGRLLGDMTQSNGVDAVPDTGITPMKKRELEIEVRQADPSHELESEFFQLGQPSMLTCPECSGALLRMNDERILRFRCHTGHAFTAGSLLVALKERIEEALWGSVRVIEESAMLLGHVAGHADERDDISAADFRQAARAALKHAKAVRSIISDAGDLPNKASGVVHGTHNGHKDSAPKTPPSDGSMPASRKRSV
jgi:two-component system chemotaxis response regulator CheB